MNHVICAYFEMRAVRESRGLQVEIVSYTPFCGVLFKLKPEIQSIIMDNQI